MAALTSTQSGNFNSSSTWGGSTPADGDTFTISAGHEVTVNSDIRTTTGYGDITVRGHLKFETNAKMRLNGRINVKGYNTAANNVSGGAWFTSGNSSTAGLLSASGNNIVLEVRGNNSDQHGVWIENERYASMKIEGDDKRTNTSNSVALDYNDEYIEVSNTSGFAEGDWISIYKEQEDDRVLGDEGFFVHDVDTTNSRIYIRQFVSPKAVVQSVNGTKVVVDNSRVFRIGYKLICGTQSVRKVATITDINHAKNELTMSASFSSSQVGKTLYQTGCEKPHPTSKTVEKIATTLTTAITSANSTNQITVGSADDISVGDTIVIDVNNDSDFGWDYNTEYNVTAKSGTTLTLNANVRYKHNAGCVVQILNRHITFKGVDTSSDTRPFLYVEYWTSYNDASTRHITLKNIRFTNWGGNTASTYYRGVMIAGYNSRYRDNETSSNYHKHQTTIQGVVVDNSNYKTSYVGLSTRHTHSATLRNCICYNTGPQGIWNWSSQHNLKMYNNYVTRTSYSSMQQDALYESYSEVSYNYLTRSDDYGYMLHQFREQAPIRHNYLLNHEQRPMYQYYANHEMIIERMHIDGFRYAPYIGTANGFVNFLDSYMDNRWHKSTHDDTPGLMDSTRYLSYAAGESRANYDRTNGNQCTFVSYEHNHMYDEKMVLTHGGCTIENSSTGGNMKVYNFTNSAMVHQQQVYVPANVTVRISAEMKMASGSFTMPSLIARPISKYGHAMGRFQTGFSGQTTVQSSTNKGFHGFLHEQYFSIKNEWEKEEITVAAQDKGYFLLVGIRSQDNSHEEVHELRPIDIRFDKPAPIKKLNNNGKAVRTTSSFNSGKKRIGGTRL